jgi:hypothetical protein
MESPNRDLNIEFATMLQIAERMVARRARWIVNDTGFLYTALRALLAMF